MSVGLAQVQGTLPGRLDCCLTTLERADVQKVQNSCGLFHLLTH